MNRTDITGKFAKSLGQWISPFTWLGSKARQARLFHPEGVVYFAKVRNIAGADTELFKLGRRFEGEAIVRMSGAWWRGGKEWADVLGCAMRFLPPESHPDARSASKQDLLFATIRRPWTTLLAPLTTNTHDFLDNDYYAVSPFEVTGFGRVKWRIVPHRVRTSGRTRGEKLDCAVRERPAVLRLEIRKLGNGSVDWKPLVEIELIEKIRIDQDALRFSPFNTGLGIEPRGLVHGLRLATYRSSQQARPQNASEK